MTPDHKTATLDDVAAKLDALLEVGRELLRRLAERPHPETTRSTPSTRRPTAAPRRRNAFPLFKTDEESEQASTPEVRQPGEPWPIAEAAEYLRTSVQTLTRAGKAGHLRVIRVGQRLFVPDEEVQRVRVEGVQSGRGRSGR